MNPLIVDTFIINYDTKHELQVVLNDDYLIWYRPFERTYKAAKVLPRRNQKPPTATGKYFTIGGAHERKLIPLDDPRHLYLSAYVRLMQS